MVPHKDYIHKQQLKATELFKLLAKDTVQFSYEVDEATQTSVNLLAEMLKYKTNDQNTNNLKDLGLKLIKYRLGR